MKNVLINGLSSNSGGGKSILDNYLALLNGEDNKSNYYVLISNAEKYARFSNKRLHFVEIPRWLRRREFFLITYKYYLPRLVKSLGIDVIFNMANIPIRTKDVKQVFLFHWAYAVYPESPVWKLMDFKSRIVRDRKSVV